MQIKLIVAAVFGILLSACNPSVDIKTAEQQIKTFQGRYNDGASGSLYALTGDSFKKVTSPEEMEELVTIVSSRLGKIETSKQLNWNVSVFNGVASTTIAMETTFEDGEGVETYIFQGSGDDLELVGWNVNSPRLGLTVDDLERLEDTSEDTTSQD